jgi:hypothetical protein
MASGAETVVRLDNYRRNTWTAHDMAWEQTALRAVAALGQGQRLTAAVLLTRAEGVLRGRSAEDDPRRAACLTLLTRLELALGERTAAMRLLPDAERAWRSALDWLERVRPGETPAEQAECRRLLQRAADYTATLGGPADRQPGPALERPLSPAGMMPDRRKLMAAVAVATCGADDASAASA